MNIRKKILFRADGNNNIGLGHLYRLFALAEIYKIISHNNIPIIITNESDNRFDEMKFIINNTEQKLITLKIPNIYEDIAFIPSLLLMDKLIKKL